MRAILSATAALTCALLATRSARAGGLEYAGQGAEALGRAGATTARATDPMVLATNPAGLAELRGSQLLFNANLALMDACVDPIGYYGWGLYLGGAPSVLRDRETGETRTLRLGGSRQESYYRDPLDTVCMTQNIVPVPQLAWTARLSERLGIGAGLLFPAVTPGGRWGGSNGIIRGDTGQLRPAPTRYMMLGSNNLGVFPTVGAGLRLLRQLRIGAAFEWGIIAVNDFTMTSAGGGTTPKNDIIAHVKAQDWFIPALTVSAHAVPVDALDVVLAFRWQDDLDARGDVDLTTGLYDPQLKPHTTGGLEIQHLTQHFPWKLRAGVRYADRLAPRPSGSGAGEADAASPEVVHDALQDERWDVELDVEYQANARNDVQELEYASSPQPVDFVSANGRTASVDGPTWSVIDKRWRNQVSVRVGSTINLLPGVVGVMVGAHYENRGVDPSYMQIDFWPVQRIGLHGGIIVRVAKAIDLVASFAHIFQETITAEPPPHQPRGVVYSCWAGTADPATCLAPPGEVGAIDKSIGTLGPNREAAPVVPEPKHGKGDGTARLAQQLTIVAPDQPPYVINSGKYRSNLDVIAAGVSVHF